MKKFFIFILLLVATVACISACDMADHDSDEQFPTFPTETNEPKEDTPPPSELFCDLSEISVWTDQDGEFYIYIKAWDVYRKMSGLKDWNKLSIIIDPTSAVISEKAGAIAVICQSGWSDTVITTYHFNMENDKVQAYTALLETEVNCEPNYYFINLYDQDCGYFFFIPECLDWHTSVAWPLIRYETTDGGKTWKEAEIFDFNLSWHKYPTITKFISYKVGIIGFRSQGVPNDLWNRTYITTDGGLTWNKISNLPSPYDDIVRYSEVLNFEQDDDGYVLTVEVRDLSYSEIIQFKSDDLTNWVCITSVSDKLTRISKHQAKNVAEQHWGLSTGDIDSGNGFEYRISIVATPTDTAPYYVVDLSWLVNYLPDSNEQHYSLVERIFIDAVSGECTLDKNTTS